MKIGRRFWIGLAVLAVFWIGTGGAVAAQQATEEMFTKDGLEYHFMLNDPIRADEASFLQQAGQLIDRLAPLFVIDPKPKKGASIYVDTKDRKLKNENLILRVREGQITLKARGPSAASVQDLAKCDAKKYEIDYFNIPEYSVSSDIKFKKEEFETRLSGLTQEKLFAFIGNRCAPMLGALKTVAGDPGAAFPGQTSQYDFKGKIRADHPMAKKVSVDLSVWFFPPTKTSSIELAFTGQAGDKAALDALKQETVKFLEKQGLLNPSQGSKTEFYFTTYMGR